MPVINIIRTTSYVMVSTALAVLGVQSCLAAKLSPMQVQSVDNDSSKIERQASTTNFRDTLQFPSAADANANVVLLDGKTMIDVASKSQRSETQNLVHDANNKVINNQNFINIAVWTFLRVIGVAILIYGFGVAVDAFSRNSK